MVALPNGPERNENVLPFSKALEKTEFGIFNYFLIFISGIVLANVLFEMTSFGFILPIAECDLKLTNEDKGVLTAIGFIGIIVSSHLWGFLADTKGRRAVIVPTLLISFGVTLVSSFSHHFWLLVFLRFVNGFFVSGSSATIYAYVGEFHIDRTRSKAVMGSACIFSIGPMILPIIAWGIINQSWSLPLPFLGIVYKPWRLFMVVCGTPGVLCGLALLLYPESPNFLLSVGKDKEAIEVLKKMHKWNGCRGKYQIERIIAEKGITIRNLNEFSSESTNFVTAFLRTMWEQTVPLFRRGLLRCTVIIYVIEFLLFASFHGMLMWFPYFTEALTKFMDHNPGNKSLICDAIYAKQTEVYKEDGTMQCAEKLEDNTYIYSLIRGTITCAELTIILIIVNKVQKVHIFFVVFVAAGACGLVTVHIQDLSIVLYVYILQITVAVLPHVLSAVIVELYPTHLRGMALCMALMLGRLGGVVGTNIIGVLLANNCEITFYISGIGLIACGFLTIFIPKQIKFNDDDDIELKANSIIA